MFDSILVPLDGSLQAECVLSHAFAIARSFDAEITLIHMLEKHQADVSAQSFDLLGWQIKKAEANLYLEKVKARFRDSDIRIHSVVLEGLAAEGIAEYARNYGAQLIILSSPERSGWSQWGISNIVQKIVLNAPTSVLIVRTNQQDFQADGSSAAPLYQRILVPLDGSQRAEHVLPITAQLAHFHESSIHLVQVIQTPEMARHMPPTPEDIDLSSRIVARNQKEAVRYLEMAKSRSYLEGIDVQTHLVTSDNAAAELHRMAEQEQIDLVILSAHGYSGNQQWPHGSMVNNFIMYGSLPLLIAQDLPARQKLSYGEFFFRERAEH